jgi:predicted MFS family arabinose efflux permease
MALAQGPWTLGLAWLGIGIGSAMGLYEAAFTTVVRLYGTSARSAITGITLIGGFTGTVSWPLSTFLEAHLGWRWACVAWAAINLFVCLPLYLSLPRDPAAPKAADALPGTPEPGPAQAPAVQVPAPTANGMDVRLNDPRVLLLAALFAVLGIVATAMASQLPGVLMASGVSAGAALWMSMLVGPTQVVARIVELRFMGDRSPMLATWLATGLHPMGALCLLLLGPPAALMFVVVHGVGNGLLTIARGALPLAIFGAKGYGQLQGWLLAPARITQAFAPWWFGLALARWGGQALWLTAGLCVLGLLALALLQRRLAVPARG